jgi:uncharacterized membrane protein YdbT with pleckstrin-like domain
MGHKKHGRYWKRFLLPNEKPIHMFGVSGAYIFLFWVVPALAVLVLAFYVGIFYTYIGLMFAVPALAMLLPAMYMAYFVHYIVTDQRVMSREGFLYKKFVTVSLSSITDMQVHESLLERMITRTGTIGVNTAGSPRIELFFHHVDRPLDRREDIIKHSQLLEEKQVHKRVVGDSEKAH